jgi:carbon-monoxide dehydrogenase large subunit
MTGVEDRRASRGPGGSILGTRVQRAEDPAFLTRGAVYTDDVVDERLSGAVHATFVRSPIAHGRILSIGTAAAAAVPGVVAVLTARDLADVPEQRPVLPMYPAQMAQPLLAGDVVRFVGEPVAVVLTEDRYAGEDAAELVEVEYDPLPAVVDPSDAAADEVLLFPALGTNVAFRSGESPPRGGDADGDGIFAGCGSSTSGSPWPRSRCAPPRRRGTATAA